MEFLPPLSEVYPFVIALLVAGVVAGFLAGLFGIGGGAVLVPVFYQVLTALGIDEAVRMHVAVGTSLAIIVPTSLQSFRKHHARGAVDMDLLRSFAIPVPIGVICAAAVAAWISGAGLRLIFACIALVIALPCLTIIANFAAIGGAMLVADYYSGVSFEAFIDRLRSAIDLSTIFAGLIKAPFMALIISVIAASEGMKVEGSAESLGRRVTSSVVKSIFVVIVVDGLFAMFYAAINF